MLPKFRLSRTKTADPDFQRLVSLLDHELWQELKEDQATYEPFNKIDDIETAVLVFCGQDPVACGCLKPFGADTVEIKRMFVRKDFRGRGLSKKVLTELENRAVEKGYAAAVLETSIHFKTACNLYKSRGYCVVPNYPPYTGLAESVCMKKDLRFQKANPPLAH